MPTNSVSKYFTRHLLRAGLQCSAKLYYKANGYVEDNGNKSFLEHAGFNKYYLKKLAGHQYNDAILVRENSRERAAGKTANLLKRQKVIILEAAFIHQSYFANVPVLIKAGDRMQLLDIQTSAFNPYKHRLVNQRGELPNKWKRYIVDLAYKSFVLENIYPDGEFEMGLMLPDKSKWAKQNWLLRDLPNDKGDLEKEDLFCQLDVTSHVKAMRVGHPFEGRYENERFDDALNDLNERYLEPRWETPAIGRKCKSCEFRITELQQTEGARSGFRRCWMESDMVPEFMGGERPVLDLIGPGVDHWLEKEIYLQMNVSPKKLPPLKSIHKAGNPITQKQRQGLQVAKAQGRKIPAEIIKQPFFDEIRRWEYPLHFLDFEAGNYAIPIRKNRKPYDLVLFQFSCHSLYADGRLKHHQWIAEDDNSYPNYALVRRLKNILDIRKGSIVQYSKFEHYALKQIRKELMKELDEVYDAAELIDWLGDIIKRRDSSHLHAPYMADLSRLVRLYYYNCFLNDSLSIKQVLQSVLTVSEVLKQKYTQPYKSYNFDDIIWWQWDDKNECAHSPYDILRQTQEDMQIGRGTEAMVTYGKILAGSLSLPKKKKALNALLKYCELDTLAMVMIYEHVNSLAQNN